MREPDIPRVSLDPTLTMTFRALDGFEEISSKPISTLSLIQAARRSFQLIEPWSEAK